VSASQWARVRTAPQKTTCSLTEVEAAVVRRLDIVRPHVGDSARHAVGEADVITDVWAFGGVESRDARGEDGLVPVIESHPFAV
jgi:hypothetical protein